MSRGIPVISTSCDGPREIISEGVDGVLVPIGDIDAMAKSINILASSVKYRRKLGTNARNKVIQQYTFNTYSKNLLDSSRKVIETYETQLKK